MKINKQKHGKENTIGKIIYGFLLFMPLLAIGVTCAYVIFNKNAYQSYSNNQNTTEYVNLENSLPQYDLYFTFNGNIDITDFDNRVKFYITNTEYIEGNLTTSDIETLETSEYIRLWRANNQNYVTWVNGSTNFSSNTYYFTLKCDLISISPTISNTNLFYKNINTNGLDNVFYYSINKVEQSPLFNWASNTGTHNVLESTCQTLGITTTFIPMLLAYWLMMSLMYLLYDIALLVVHMAHNRIHDIESSI